MQSFGQLVRKLWSRHRFNVSVMAQEFYHEVGKASDGRFSQLKRREAPVFFAWLVAALDKHLAAKSKGAFVR